MKLKGFISIAERLLETLLEWGSETEYCNTTKFEYGMKDVWELAWSYFEDV